MARPKPPRLPGKIWRISKRAPMGEWVDPSAPKPETPAPSKDLPEVSYGTWVTSSYDLLDGADIIEDPDTIPGELLDELFAPKSKRPSGRD